MFSAARLPFKQGDTLQVLINDKSIFTMGPNLDSRPRMTFDGTVEIAVEFNVKPEAPDETP